jgi:hypothetical protein
VQGTSLSLEEVMQHKKELAATLKEYARGKPLLVADAFLISADIVENTPLFVKENKDGAKEIKGMVKQ